jgi:hypothetical protein
LHPVEVIKNELRLFAIEAVGVKRRRVDLGPEPAALVGVGGGFESLLSGRASRRTPRRSN